ncbi:hypothetical protein ILYODFUR_011627 [Ilyodon furcidens]|uniref:Uncharacterized protein n=1 Tax=Ilyodon furcidens TaxID=33524 RepID=A0ABV0UF87_9TELE
MTDFSLCVERKKSIPWIFSHLKISEPVKDIKELSKYDGWCPLVSACMKVNQEAKLHQHLLELGPPKKPVNHALSACIYWVRSIEDTKSCYHRFWSLYHCLKMCTLAHKTKTVKQKSKMT